MDADDVRQMFESLMKTLREERDKEYARLRGELAAAQAGNRQLSRAMMRLKGASESLHATLSMVNSTYELNDPDHDTIDASLDTAWKDILKAESIVEGTTGGE